MENNTVLIIIGWIITTVLAIVGWITGYKLTLKSLNKNLVNKITNDARMEIVKEIRSYQSWLSSASGLFSHLNAIIINLKYTQKLDFKELLRSNFNVLHDLNAPINWVNRLEENEILFPQTSKIRLELVNRHHELFRFLSKYNSDLQSELLNLFTSKDKSRIKNFIEWGEGKTESYRNNPLIIDQMALMQDLLTHLQNISLSSITGNEIPERIPTDTSAPRIDFEKELIK